MNAADKKALTATVAAVLATVAAAIVAAEVVERTQVEVTLVTATVARTRIIHMIKMSSPRISSRTREKTPTAITRTPKYSGGAAVKCYIVYQRDDHDS